MRAAALLLAAALAACVSDDGETCPGEPVGTLTFTLTDPVGPPQCTRQPPEGSTVVGGFRGTLSTDPALGTAAICVEGAGDLSQPYFGRVDGGVFALSSAGGIAVLADPCGANCSASATARIDGTMSAGTFTGTLTERFASPQGDCGTCTFPCEAIYALTGVP